jgi:hypothetical protein
MSRIPQPFMDERGRGKGAPVNGRGTIDGLMRLQKAFRKLEVVGVGRIDAKIDWVNDYPRITISLRDE